MLFLNKYVSLKVLDGTKISLAQQQNQKTCKKNNFCAARLNSKIRFL
jgi:hypothetical protein